MKNLLKILSIILRSIKSRGFINSINKIFTDNFHYEEYDDLTPIKTIGLINTIRLVRYYYLFEVKYSTKTRRWEFPDDLNVERDTPEHGTKLEELVSKQGQILDFGCGKGRPLLVALEHGVKKVIGVEYDKNLCDICLNNLNNYSKGKNYDCKYEVIEMDASFYNIDDDVNVILLFNPFDEQILAKVMSNISKSIKRKSRIIYIVYSNPVHKDRLGEEYRFFASLDEKTIIYKLAYE